MPKAEKNKGPEEEADYRPTEDLEVDVSQLSEEDRQEKKFSVPWGLLIFCGVIVTLMIACIIVIIVLNGAVAQ